MRHSCVLLFRVGHSVHALSKAGCKRTGLDSSRCARERRSNARPLHSTAVCTPCMWPRALSVRSRSLCGAAGQSRLQDVHSELVPCRRGRGGSLLGARWSLHHRVLAACAYVGAALRRRLVVGSEATKTPPTAPLGLKVLGRHTGLARPGRGWPRRGLVGRWERPRDVSIEVTETRPPRVSLILTCLVLSML